MIDYNNDDELADAVQRGDIAAQETFFNRFQVPLIKFAMSKHFSFEDAEDLAQETLAVGFMNIASFRRGEILVRWLCGIEDKFMRRRWADAKRGDVLPLDDETAAPQRLEQIGPEKAKELGRLWAQTQLNMSLAPNQMHMQAVVMRYLDRLEYLEIEAALRLAKNTAKVYVQRGLKKLKEMSEANAPEDPPRSRGR